MKPVVKRMYDNDNDKTAINSEDSQSFSTLVLNFEGPKNNTRTHWRKWKQVLKKRKKKISFLEFY